MKSTWSRLDYRRKRREILLEHVFKFAFVYSSSYSYEFARYILQQVTTGVFSLSKHCYLQRRKDHEKVGIRSIRCVSWFVFAGCNVVYALKSHPYFDSQLYLVRLKIMRVKESKAQKPWGIVSSSNDNSPLWLRNTWYYKKRTCFACCPLSDPPKSAKKGHQEIRSHHGERAK